MEYNYYPTQPGHPPPNMSHQGGPQVQQPSQGNQVLHPPMPSQNNRQTMPPGPHQQQMQQMHPQQQQNLGHHPQQMVPQQQQHQHHNYQIQSPHPHGSQVSHSSSPHPHPQQHQHQHHHLNHQSPIPVQLPQQSPLSNQHMHPQSPHQHHSGPVHMQQQQPINQMVRPQLGSSVVGHPHPGMQQPMHHQQNFFNSGPVPQSSMHHYPQQNQHHPHHQPPHHQHHQHHQHQRHQPSMMHHHVTPMNSHHPQHVQLGGIGRNSPYYPYILQTEFRIIELNKRLQCRPISRHPISPLPSPNDESSWWERFALDFFEDDATLTLRTNEDKPVEYTIGRTLIPRFFKTYFDGGVTDLSINLRNPKEACVHPHLITLDCDQAFITTNNIFSNANIGSNQGVVVHTDGHLIIDFVNNFDQLSIKSWRFYTKCSREFIDRSILAAMGVPNNYPVEPATRNGLTKSTITYLKMCMIMEPMQDLMFQHKQTKMDPRSCLRKHLQDKYKFRSDDGRVATNKRRKRKSSAAPAVTGTNTNKKSKAGANSNNIMNSSGLNNNMMMSPSAAPPTFSLASQDVMVVGEPSMMGGDFGDDNERMITRLENTQYDPTTSVPSNAGSDSMNGTIGSDNGMHHNSTNSLEQNMENHIMSPAIMQQQQHNSPLQQQQQQQQQPQISQPTTNFPISQNHGELDSPKMSDQRMQVKLELDLNHDSLDNNQVDQTILIEQQLGVQQQATNSSDDELAGHKSQVQALEQFSHEKKPSNHIDVAAEESNVLVENEQQLDIKEESLINSITTEPTNGDSGDMVLDSMNSADQTENHNNSVQNNSDLNDESNSNSQTLPCSTATTNSSAMEQQQPVDNGVA